MWNAPHCSAASPSATSCARQSIEPRLLGAVLQRAPRDLVVVRLVRLPEVGGVGVRDGALARASSEAPRSCRGRPKTRCRPSGRPERSEGCCPSDSPAFIIRVPPPGASRTSRLSAQCRVVTVPDRRSSMAATPRSRLVSIDLRGHALRVSTGPGGDGRRTRPGRAPALLDRLLARARGGDRTARVARSRSRRTASLDRNLGAATRDAWSTSKARSGRSLFPAGLCRRGCCSSRRHGYRAAAIDARPSAPADSLLIASRCSTARGAATSSRSSTSCTAHADAGLTRTAPDCDARRQPDVDRPPRPHRPVPFRSGPARARRPRCASCAA